MTGRSDTFAEIGRRADAAGLVRYYDLDDKPTDGETWRRLFEARDAGGRWRVGKTAVPGGEVSTVWLGLDHSWGAGPPQIYETLVFRTAIDGEMQRYATRQEAIDGHDAMVARAVAAGEIVALPATNPCRSHALASETVRSPTER